MRKSLLSKMDLQFFDADNGSDGGGQEGTPATTNPEQTPPDETGSQQEQAKTFTRDEVAKIIAAETSKKQKAWEQEQEAKQAEAEKLAKMNAQEKMQHELEKKEAEIADLKRNQALSEMKTEASKMLSDAELPHDEDLLSLIVSDDAEVTKKAVAIVTSFASKIKKEGARQQTPNEGGQFSSDKKLKDSVAAIAASTRIVK